MKINKEEVEKDYHWIYSFKHKGYEFKVVVIDNIDPMEKARWPHLQGLLNCHIFMETPDGTWNNNMKVSTQMFTDVLEDILFGSFIGDDTIRQYKKHLEHEEKTAL